MTTGRPGTGPRAGERAIRAAKPRKLHKDIIESPALPVPPPRFVPVVRHEPMRRSTRAERMNEIMPEWRRFLHPWNVPYSELTEDEKRRYGR